MKSPLSKALDDYLKKDYSSFHTPGHKGNIPLDPNWDITEIPGFESLYESTGAIRETEKALTDIYGCETVLSAGGSTLAIQTMLAMALPFGAKVICGRNIHTSAVNACALLDLTPIWVYPKVDSESGLGAPITAKQIENCILQNPDAKGVYLTSPDYYGQITDIEGVSKVCKKHKLPLLIDCAHGAHFNFLRSNLHPINLGASLACGSLHKTLPVLTGGAALFLSDDYTAKQAKEKMSIFGSTSPSYLILQSCDGLIPWLSTTAKKDYQKLDEQILQIKVKAEQAGFYIPKGTDPTRLTLGFWSLGYTKNEFISLCDNHKIQPEYTDDNYCVLIATTKNTQKDFNRVLDLLESATKQKMGSPIIVEYPISTMETSVRQAVFAESTCLPVDECVGRVATSIIAPCPPGIPIVIPGEMLTAESVATLKRNSIFKINVI